MDDDEQANAFDRAMGYDSHVYFEFANIVQHYEDVARPAHDDIDFEPSDPDTMEFDSNGVKIILVDPMLILDILHNDDLLDAIQAFAEAVLDEPEDQLDFRLEEPPYWWPFLNEPPSLN